MVAFYVMKIKDGTLPPTMYRKDGEKKSKQHCRKNKVRKW